MENIVYQPIAIAKPAFAPLNQVLLLNVHLAWKINLVLQM